MILFYNLIFFNGFYESKGDLGSFRSDDMDYSYDNEAPECKIITMKSMVFMVLTTAPTDTHDFTNNPYHCIDTDNIKPGMDYFLEKAHYENSAKYVMTYN